MGIKFLLISLLIAVFIICPANATPIASADIESLGYEIHLITGYSDYHGPYTFSTYPYSQVSPKDNITSAIDISVPYNTPGELLYINLVLANGTIIKGSYQDLGSDNYILTLDGVSNSGTYSYSWMQKISQLLGRYNYNTVGIYYATKISNPTEFAIYLGATSNLQDGMHSVILQPISPPNNDIITFSLQSNNRAQVTYIESQQIPFIDYNDDAVYGDPVGNAENVINGLVQGSLKDYVDVIWTFVNDLLFIASSLIGFVLLIFLILKFLIDPFNIILFLILFEELAFIVALTGRGDTIDAIAKYGNYNVTMFTFAIFMAKGMIQVISSTIQALALAAQAGATVANMGIDVIKSLGAWIATVIVFKRL